MGSKLAGKFEAAGRAGIRDKETEELVAVYPYKVNGTDQEIERKVHNWFFLRINAGFENRSKSCQNRYQYPDYRRKRNRKRVNCSRNTQAFFPK